MQIETGSIEKQKQEYFLQGILLGLIPVALLVLHQAPLLFTGVWEHVFAIALPAFLCCGVAVLFRLPAVGRMFVAVGVCLAVILLYPALVHNPLLALFVGVTVIVSLYYLFSSQIVVFSDFGEELMLERFKGSAFALTALTLFSPVFIDDNEFFSWVCLVGFCVMLWCLGRYWVVSGSPLGRRWVGRILLLTAMGAAIALAWYTLIVFPVFVLAVLGSCYSLRSKHAEFQYLRVFMEHPGRSVFLTFFVLCAGGTLLLRTPVAMVEEISVLDAGFTSVSATCVTGLSTIDILSQLTWTGRLFLLFLIQAGGLGIMTLASLVLHALGRVSLNHEQLLSKLTSADEHDIFQNLKLIVKTTFVIETTGALLLTAGFYFDHGDFWRSLDLGVFTSVSAFCNAGFFPHPSNMQPYTNNYFVLFVTAFLIIMGGIAPAVTVSVIRARSNKNHLNLVSKLVVFGTIFMLASSMLLLLLFEWDGIFGELSPIGKAVNGFFLAASLRTAGFNTVFISGCGVPAIIVMLLCMFIGGAPGGNAGGVKITTLALFLLALRTAIRGEENMELDRHRIPGKSLLQAVAIVVSAALVLLVVVIMLSTTQASSTDKMVFEAFSALGTVGLSLGGTGELDQVGKLIIMATMFIGRIGPLTLFLIFGEERGTEKNGYPPVSVPLG